MWKLETEQNESRTWRNIKTNSECRQNLVYHDKDSNKWWEFSDLAMMPFTRKFAAAKIESLYMLGLSAQDFELFFFNHKATLKSKDLGEKYETAYSEILEFENKYKAAADPLRQLSSLVCVYFTMNDEAIDSFMNDLQLKKMLLLESDPQMHTFFLKRQIDLIERYKDFLVSTSRTVFEEKSEQ